MKSNEAGIIGVIVTSFVIASMANVYPLSFDTAVFRPMFMILVLMFWVLYQPRFVGISVAFLVGLICDLLLDTMLGSQAFSVVIASLCVQIGRGFTKRLQLSSAWILSTAGLLIYRVFMWIFESFRYDYIGFSSLVGLVVSIGAFPVIWWVLVSINNKIDKQYFL